MLPGGLVHLDLGSSDQPYAYKHVLARAQMVIKCQGKEPRTSELWGVERRVETVQAMQPGDLGLNFFYLVR